MIRIGIAGYGNLGRGVESAVNHAEDMELVAVFTRRAPEALTIATPTAQVASFDDIQSWKDKIDVIINCGGSATDLPETTPFIAQYFNVIDSFDNHNHIPEHFAKVDEAATAAGTSAVISCGWDPGLFSLARLYANCVLPTGADYTFWGRGVSQGHSDAIRRIPGVIDARQYTVPVPEAMERVRTGECPTLTTGEKHTRECFVVCEEGADRDAIEQAIVTMPDYFADYDTTVNFISMEELQANHSGLPHGGSAIRTGKTGLNHEFNNTIEFSLNLDSNPFFTGSVLTIAARGIYRMHQEGSVGAKTMFDIPPAYLSNLSGEEIRAHLL